MVQTWFITGCSSGFGEEFVRQLRTAGDNVIATGRNSAEKLAHLKDTGATIMELDVNSSEDIITAKINEAWEIYGGIDYIVNNAGFMSIGAFEDTRQADIEAAMQTMFHGPLNITRAALGKMRPLNKGKIVYINSFYSRFGSASATGYTSAKWALAGAVEAISHELSFIAPGVKLLSLEPGFFQANQLHVKVQCAKNRVPAYTEFMKYIVGSLEPRFAAAPGDTKKGVATMIEIMRGTGCAEGKTVPTRLVLGSDGLEKSREVSQEALRVMDEWEKVALGTDRDGYVKPPEEVVPQA